MSLSAENHFHSPICYHEQRLEVDNGRKLSCSVLIRDRETGQMRNCAAPVSLQACVSVGHGDLYDDKTYCFTHWLPLCIENDRNPYLSLCLNKYFEANGIQNNITLGRVNFKNIISCFPVAMQTSQFKVDIMKHNHLNKKLMSKHQTDRDCVKKHTAHLFGADDSSESDSVSEDSDDESSDDDNSRSRRSRRLINRNRRANLSDDLSDDLSDENSDDSQSDGMSGLEPAFEPSLRRAKVSPLDDILNDSQEEPLSRPKKKAVQPKVTIIDSDTDSETFASSYVKEEDLDDEELYETEDDEDLDDFVTENIITSDNDEAYQEIEAAESKSRKRKLETVPIVSNTISSNSKETNQINKKFKKN